MSHNQEQRGRMGMPGDPNNWHYQQGRAQNQGGQSGGPAGATHVGGDVDPNFFVGLGYLLILGAILAAIAAAVVGVFQFAAMMRPIYPIGAPLAAATLGILLAHSSYTKGSERLAVGSLLLFLGILILGVIGAFPGNPVFRLSVLLLSAVGVIGGWFFLLKSKNASVYNAASRILAFALLVAAAIGGMLFSGVTVSMRAAWPVFLCGCFMASADLTSWLLCTKNPTFKNPSNSNLFITLGWLFSLVIGGAGVFLIGH